MPIKHNLLTSIIIYCKSQKISPGHIFIHKHMLKGTNKRLWANICRAAQYSGPRDHWSQKIFEVGRTKWRVKLKSLKRKKSKEKDRKEESEKK